MIQFNNIKEGLKALSYEDAQGEPDPIMSVVNSDSIEKFHHLLLASNNAQMHGTTMVIDKEPPSLYERCWLYNFVQQTEKRNVGHMVREQLHFNTLYEKVKTQFARGIPLQLGLYKL